MKIKKTSNGIIAIGDGGNSSLEGFSNKANNYLERSKNALPKIQQDILACEEKLKDIPVPHQFKIDGAYGGWGLYTIKDKEIQNYGETLNQIITIFYSHVEKEMKNTADKKQFALITKTINQRKIMVTKAILKEIHDFQMDKLVHEYNDGKEKYDCSPMEIATINRGEKTYIHTIFNPIADMKIIARVGLHSGGNKTVHDICISQDVFSPKNEVNNGDDYLANLMGHETKQDLLTAMKEGDKGLSEEGEKIISLGLNIKRAAEDTN